MLAIILTLSILALGSGTAWLLAAREQPLPLKKTLLRIALAIALFAAFGMAGKLTGKLPLSVVFLLAQLGILLAGIVHYRLLVKLRPAEQGSFFKQESLFTLFLAALGGIVFALVFDWNDRGGFAPVFVPAVALFLLPLLAMRAFEFWEVIPIPIYKKWFYPPHQTLPLIELVDTITLHFKLKKMPGDDAFIKVAVRVPPGKTVGELFHYFIYRHNTEKDPGHPIGIGTEGNLFAWVLYIKPNWLQKRRFLDPALSVIQNGIRENATIVALQFLEKQAVSEEEPDVFFNQNPAPASNGTAKPKQPIF